MKCKELIRQGMIWNVEDGKDISFWFDNWIDKKCLRDLLNLYESEISYPTIKVYEFIQNKQWNVCKLSQTINNRSIV